jgi:integrase
MAKPRTGSLIWNKSGWRARLTVTEDGERVQRVFNLGTTSRAAAKAKMRRLLAETAVAGVAVDSARPETVDEAADRVLGASDNRGIKVERGRYAKHVSPRLGSLSVVEVRAHHVRDMLDELLAEGLSAGSLAHVRKVANAVFDALWRDELIPENPVARVRTPRGHRDARERAVLTDAELAVYLAWEHPDPTRRIGVLERQTMAVVSRCFGGVRTGDLHALRWEAFEREDDDFVRGWAPRRKTSRPQLLAVPAPMRPILRDWWERQGRPTEGLVFPALTGAAPGKGAKHGVSHAAAMREDLRRAFSIDVLIEERVRVKDKRCAAGTRPVVKRVWRKGREMTPREVELLEGTEHVRPVDFHSWRRAYVQALADAGATAQQAQALAGHADLSAHQRYLVNTAKLAEVPAAALPLLTVSARPALIEPSFQRATRDSNLRPLAPENGSAVILEPLTAQNALNPAGSVPPNSPATCARAYSPRLFAPVARDHAACADAALAAWLTMRAGQVAALRLGAG